MSKSLLLGFLICGVAGSAIAQQHIAVDSDRTATQSIRLRPGFQQEIVLRGKPTISSIHIGDPKVVGVTVTSDKRFILNALHPTEPGGPEARSTNVLVSDAEKNIVANLDIEVGYSDDASHVVEIHKRIGGGKTEDRIGIEKYVCSPVKCELVSRDKPELPVQVIQQDSRNLNINR